VEKIVSLVFFHISLSILFLLENTETLLFITFFWSSLSSFTEKLISLLLFFLDMLDSTLLFFSHLGFLECLTDLYSFLKALEFLELILF